MRLLNFFKDCLLAICITIILWLITGCATTQEVKIPIPISCKVETPVEPVSVFDALTDEATLFEKVKALLIDRENSIAYGIEMRAALAACKS